MRLFAFAVAVSLTSCVLVKQIAYTPNPSRIADPKAELKALFDLPDVQVTFDQNLLLVKQQFPDSMPSEKSLRLDRVETILMQQRGDSFEVVVHQTSGKNFVWESDEEHAKRAVDALTALTQRPAPAPSSNDR